MRSEKMGNIKDIYDLIKELMCLAEEAKNKPMSELANDLQVRFF